MQKLLTQYRSGFISKYLIAAVLIIVPLYPKFPLFNIPGTYVAVRFEDLLLLILGLITALAVLQNYKKFIHDKIFRAVFLFAFVGLVSLISAVFITKTVSIHLGLLHLIRRIEYMVPFFAILTLFNKQTFYKNINYYLGVILVVVGVLFIYGVGQRYWNFPIIITQNQEYSKGIALRFTPGSHINSTFAGHYDLASYMVLMLPVLISLIFILKEKMSKILLIITSAGGMWLLVNSLSRIAQVSYLIALGVAFISIKKYKEYLLVGVISVAIIMSSSGLYQRFSRFFNVYAADEVVVPVETPMEVYEDRSTNIRLAVEWPRAVRALSKNPLLGTGYSSINLATDNDYLRALGETGILGFLTFIFLIISIFKEFLKALPFTNKFSGLELGLITGVFGGFVGTLLTAFFIDIFEASKFATILWTMLGMAVFLIRNKQNVQKI